MESREEAVPLPPKILFENDIYLFIQSYLYNIHCHLHVKYLRFYRLYTMKQKLEGSSPFSFKFGGELAPAAPT